MIGHPEMLRGIGMPRPPCRRGIVLRAEHRLALPVAGRAQAGPFPDQRREPGIASEMAIDGSDVGTEIEYAADPRHDGRQRLYRGEVDSDEHRVTLGEMRHRDAAALAVEVDAAMPDVLSIHSVPGVARNESADSIPAQS